MTAYVTLNALTLVPMALALGAFVVVWLRWLYQETTGADPEAESQRRVRREMFCIARDRPHHIVRTTDDEYHIHKPTKENPT